MTNAFRAFNFKTENELVEKMNELNLAIPFESDISILKKEVKVGEKALKNSDTESDKLQSTITVDGSANNQMNNPTIQTAIDNAKDGDTLKVYVHSEYTAIFVCTKTPERGKVYYVPGRYYIPITDAINYIANIYDIDNFLYHEGYRYYKLDI